MIGPLKATGSPTGLPVARVGDPCTHGATIISGSPHRFVDGKAIARVGDLVDCPLHGQNKITTGSSNVFVDGQPAAHVGSITECGAEVQSGSTTSLTQQ